MCEVCAAALEAAVGNAVTQLARYFANSKGLVGQPPATGAV